MMFHIEIDVKNEFGELVNGLVQIGEHVLTVVDGKGFVELPEGEYLARAIVDLHRGQSQKVEIKGNDTITLFVSKRG
jgi:hypothetical protein